MADRKKPGPKPKGSAYRDDKGRWCVRIPLPPDGKRRKQVTLPESYNDWEEKRVRKLALEWGARAMKDPALLPGASKPTKKPVTVSNVVDRWLVLIEESPKLRAATKKQHRTSGKRIRERFGASRFAELTTGDLRAWVRDLRSAYAPSTVHNVFNSLGRLWDDAIAENWIEADNLCRNRKVREELPAIVVHEDKKAHFTIAQARRLLACKRIPAVRRVLYALGFLTGGGRVGELVGLVWNDVKTQKGVEVLRIERAIALVSESDDKVQDPKTASGKRVVPLHRTARAWLGWWQTTGWADHVGRAPTDQDPILPNAKGEPWRDQRIADRLREDLQAAKLETTFEGSPLDTRAWRRSFSTWLEAEDAHPNHVKRLMGHSRGDVTSKHYTARDLEALLRTVELIDLEVSPPGGGNLSGEPVSGPKTRTYTRRTAKSKRRKSALSLRRSARNRLRIGFENRRRGDSTEGSNPFSSASFEALSEFGADGASPAADKFADELHDVEAAISIALTRAAEAGRFDVVAQLAKELEARRLGAADNVVAIATAKKGGGRG